MPKKLDSDEIKESVLEKYGDMALTRVDIDNTLLAQVPKETFEHAFTLLYDEGKPVQKVYLELCKSHTPTVSNLIIQTAKKMMQNPIDVAEQNNTLIYSTVSSVEYIKVLFCSATSIGFCIIFFAV